MKLRTELSPIDFPEKISLSHSLITIGSCFSNTIGNKLSDNKLECLVNPFSTIYDPFSITRLLRMAINQVEPDSSSMVESDGVWKNLLFHSSINGLSKDELALKIRVKLNQVRTQLENVDWLMITFGTAFIYNHTATNQNVANCQKLAASDFKKELISNSSLIKDFESFHQELISFNPKIKIILTVSPVRHIRDGLEENSVSKSILRIMCNSLTREHANIYYYPSFEIIQDDLRDYRFYKEDLIHPNKQADEYIWNHFSQSFFNAELTTFQARWSKLNTSLKHRPFNPGTKEHQQFLQKLLAELEQLSGSVNLKKEIGQVKGQILEVQ